MAKYADYVKNQPNVEQELEEVEQKKSDDQSAETTQAQTVIPERFKGKTPEEIAQSYVELEKAYSRQGQDIGRLRRLVDEEVLESQLSRKVAEKPPTKPVTVDDLYENADATLRRVVQEETSARVEELERQLQAAKQQQALTEFSAKYPDWQEQVKDPAFLNWIAEDPYRQRLAQAADAGDLAAADVLFGIHRDLKGKARRSAEDKRRRDTELRDASLESSGPAAADMTQVYSRADLMEQRVRARQGDQKAIRYLNAHQNRIRKAYEEGRIVD